MQPSASALSAVVAIIAGALCSIAFAQSEPPPSGLSADANRYAGPVPLRVKLSATYPDATGSVAYRWCFDDGTESREQNPRHRFDRAGYYRVVVQAQDQSGSRKRRSLLLGVWPPKQWAAAQRKPITKKAARRAQRVQQERTRKRLREIDRSGGLTREKCIGQPLP